MRKTILTVLMTGICFCCNAQFHHHHDDNYTAQEVARATVNAIEDYNLNNTMFNENALKQNPEVWANYQIYRNLQDSYNRKSKFYKILGWSGMGTLAISGITLNAVDSDQAAIVSGFFIAGTAAALVGSLGLAVYSNKMKVNKKEFIYYLKTSNDGIGIVTLF